MKHGAGFRKLSKKTSHRMLMLRNLVTSLLEHEQIKTTLPKARETARLAEKVSMKRFFLVLILKNDSQIITLGKNGDEPSFRRATAFVLKPQVLPKLFTSLRERYADRPGGYTRIHKFGNRPGDNAPNAIIELVDNPRDLKVEVTAKAVGWELLARRIRDGGEGLQGIDMDEVMGTVRSAAERGTTKEGPLRELTKRNLGKLLKFRGEKGLTEIGEKAGTHMVNPHARLLAEPQAFQGLRHLVETEEEKSKGKHGYSGWTVRAGQRLAGMTNTATSLRLAQGALGKRPLQRSLFWEKRTKLGVRADSSVL
ncbi:ribosomal protein L17 [Ramaria rubella]|nr:ribosomal protein L17 [Ramaria rubella]